VKNFIRDYLTFNRRERKGTIVLVAIVLLLIGYLSFSSYLFPKEKYDSSEFDKQVAEIEKQDHVEDSLNDSKFTYDQNDYKLPNSSQPKIKQQLFPFNPNNLPDANWKKLGLSDKQIKSIKNYEAKGGKFRKKEDVKKMYVITAEMYASLEPYIQIPEEEKKTETNKPFEKKEYVKEKLLVELNSADTAELDKLKGIGSSFAKRIVKYRDLLGGFVKKEQLLEVYGFDKEKYDGLSENITVDVSKVKKININTATVEELKKQVYIKYNLAKLIVNYRKQHGNFKSVEEIKKLDLVNDELFAKLAPYLTIE